MSRTYWFLIFAFGLALLTSQAQGQAPENSKSEQPSEEQAAEKTAIEDAPVIFMLPTEPSNLEHDGSAAEDSQEDVSQYLIFGESWAQWVIAAASIAALFLSGWAVWLVYKTLNATRDAVKSADDAVDVTRDIGKAQLRAYLSCTGGKFSIVNDLCVLNVYVRNFGQSPAKLIKLSGCAILPNANSSGNDDQLIRGPVYQADIFNLPPSGKTDGHLLLHLDFPREDVVGLQNGGWIATTECSLEWSDVFDDVQRLDFYLIQATSDFVHPEGLPMRREGRMGATNTQPQQE